MPRRIAGVYVLVAGVFSIAHLPRLYLAEGPRGPGEHRAEGPGTFGMSCAGWHCVFDSTGLREHKTCMYPYMYEYIHDLYIYLNRHGYLHNMYMQNLLKDHEGTTEELLRSY